MPGMAVGNIEQAGGLPSVAGYPAWPTPPSLQDGEKVDKKYIQVKWNDCGSAGVAVTQLVSKG